MSDTNPFMRLERQQSVIYHRGLLALDAVLSIQPEPIARARRWAWEAYQAGRVILVQRRITNAVAGGGCEYIAIGR